MRKLNKKIIVIVSLIFALILSFSSIKIINVFAHQNDMFNNFSCKSALLMHSESGQVLYAKNEHNKMQVASICKLMTTLITLEKIEQGALSLDDMLIASEYACSMEGSQAFLDAGSSYKVSELLKSVIVASANDSAVVLAEGIAGNEQEFVRLMNQRAKELKMNNTLYANSTGLPATEQYSTAYDTALLLREVGKYKVFNEDSKIWMDKLIHPSGRETELVNTNRLIKYYTPCINGKTGFTDEAGYCLASTASSKGLNLIAVTLNCPNASNRFKECMELFNYGFANYENKQVLKNGEVLKTIKVHGGKQDEVGVTSCCDYYVINKKGDKSEITINYELNNKVNAPLKEGQKIGKILVIKQGKVIGEVDAVTTASVEKQTFGSAFNKIINKWKIGK